ncbi:MAG TPA: DUF1587 domain-containing protein, partial [Gemmatimonadales bacterium]|nr:DUF1587 domain-containing protein [Gemmatimonadales bacterium]
MAAWLVWNVGLAAIDPAPAPTTAPAQSAAVAQASADHASAAQAPAAAPTHPGSPAQAHAAAKLADAAGSDAPQKGPPGASQNWPMLKQYCEKCHNAEDWAGNIAFDTMTPGEISEDAETWEKAIVKLRGRLMPPPGQKQPPSDQIHSFVHFMETSLDDSAASRPPQPGRVALHRLNRKEYANAIWDLLAVKVDPTTILPTDDTIDGFDNVANVLQVSPSFLDQYLTAARSIAVDAVGEVPNHPSGTQYIVKDAGNQEEYEEGLPLGTRGGMQVSHYFPADGEYELNISNMAVALWVTGMNFDNHVIATLDGKKFWETHVGGEEDMKSIDQKQDPAV